MTPAEAGLPEPIAGPVLHLEPFGFTFVLTDSAASAASFDVAVAWIVSLSLAFFFSFTVVVPVAESPASRSPSLVQAGATDALLFTERQTLTSVAPAPPLLATSTSTLADPPALTFFGAEIFVTSSRGALPM